MENETSEEQKHYESLISLLKYSVSMLMGLFTIAGIFVSFLTYRNGAEMREGLNKEREEVRQRFNDMKSDLTEQRIQLNEKEKKLEIEVGVLQDNVNTEINTTKDEALSEIGNIKTVAIIESRKKIEEVFRERNLDDYIEQIAIQKMQPKIQYIMDSLQKAKINIALDNLKSSDESVVANSISVLETNAGTSLNPAQLQKIIDVLNSQNISDPNGQLINLLKTYKTKQVYNFYMYGLTHSPDLYNGDLDYVMNPIFEYDIQDYEIMINISTSKSPDYVHLLTMACNYNKKLFNSLINNKNIVDAVLHSENDLGWIEQYDDSIKGTSIRCIGEASFKNSYYFKSYNERVKELQGGK